MWINYLEIWLRSDNTSCYYRISCKKTYQGKHSSLFNLGVSDEEMKVLYDWNQIEKESVEQVPVLLDFLRQNLLLRTKLECLLSGNTQA